MSKTTLVIGGIVAVIAVLFLVSRSQRASVAALNQPGLLYTPTQYQGGTLGNILDATQVGVSAISNLRAAFGSGGSGSNDPGLEDYSY